MKRTTVALVIAAAISAAIFYALMFVIFWSPLVWAQELAVYANDDPSYRELPVCPGGPGCERFVCRVYVPPAEQPEAWLVFGQLQATSDDLRDRGRSAGLSLSLWICKDFMSQECREIRETHGGENISPAGHHAERPRSWPIIAEPGDRSLQLQAWAYNKRARAGDTVRVDGCAVAVVKLPYLIP